MDGLHTTAGIVEVEGSRAHPSAIRSTDLSHRQSIPLPWRGWTGAPKRLSDIVIASALLVPLLPLMGLIALLILAGSGSGVLVRHPRIGRDGRVFRCLKFRTMVKDGDRVLANHLERNPEARQEWARQRKLLHDPRVTAVGHLLRRTSLDELPQFFNVLRGEMSVVGPRPVVKAELDEHYRGEARALYCSVRPGITGLWQVSGRSTLNYQDRVRLDVEYVRNGSAALDVTILLRTPCAVLRARGAC